jgi:hypothetical protein
MQAIATINGCPEKCERYIVAITARPFEGDGSFWFWGSWEEKAEAERVAREIRGYLFEKPESAKSACYAEMYEVGF